MHLNCKAYTISFNLKRCSCARPHDLYWVEAMTLVFNNKVVSPNLGGFGISLRHHVLTSQLSIKVADHARPLFKFRKKALLPGSRSCHRTVHVVVRASARPATVDEGDVARLGVDADTTVYVKEPTDSKLSLGIENYMTLPPEQYSALDPNLISHLEKNRFRLRVPKLKLYGLWVAPVVDIVATQLDNPARVVLTSENCTLHGSDWVRRVQLNNFFTVKFQTVLSWNSSRAVFQKGDTASITGTVFLEVFTRVIPPFNLIPRPMLEGSVNAILRGLIRTMLPFFMHRLAADYRRWATDEEYRAFRESMGCEVKQHCSKTE